jgi:hypothetical protein
MRIDDTEVHLLLLLLLLLLLVLGLARILRPRRQGIWLRC